VKTDPAQAYPSDGIKGLVSVAARKAVLVKLLPCWEILKLSRALYALARRRSAI